MYAVYIVVTWWLMGFISFLVTLKLRNGEVTLREFLMAFPFGIMGPIVILIWLGVKFEEKMTFLDKKLF